MEDGESGSQNLSGRRTDQRRPITLRASRPPGSSVGHVKKISHSVSSRHRSNCAISRRQGYRSMKSNQQLRAIPAVEKVLQALGEVDLPRPAVVAAVRRELAALRKEGAIPEFEPVLSRVRHALNKLRSARI